MVGFFFVISILIMLGSGGCSIAVLISEGSDILGIVLLIGGIPFAVGFVIYLMSRGALNRRYGAQQPDVKED